MHTEICVEASHHIVQGDSPSSRESFLDGTDRIGLHYIKETKKSTSKDDVGYGNGHENHRSLNPDDFVDHDKRGILFLQFLLHETGRPDRQGKDAKETSKKNQFP